VTKGRGGVIVRRKMYGTALRMAVCPELGVGSGLRWKGEGLRFCDGHYFAVLFVVSGTEDRYWGVRSDCDPRPSWICVCGCGCGSSRLVIVVLPSLNGIYYKGI
jgi:hypothetical protein